MSYVEQEDLAKIKTALNVELDDPREDVLLDVAIAAAEEAINDFCHRTFTVGGPTTTREFDPTPGSDLLFVDDIASATGLIVASSDGIFSGYSSWPRNALAKGKPIMGFRSSRHGTWSSYGVASPVMVTAQWGWPAVPASVRQAMIILAVRLFKRKESPEGVGGWNEMGAVRITAQDPDVARLLTPYTLPSVR